MKTENYNGFTIIKCPSCGSDIALDRETTKNQECVDRATILVNDVLPQMGGLCIQDFGNLNELCMLLRQLKSENIGDTDYRYEIHK